MYLDVFGLSEPPFSIAPDPRYLYMSEKHREGLAHLLYGLKGDSGFVLLTGEVGTGKTTVCRCLLEQIPENTKIAFVLHPKLTAEELLATICEEFGIRVPGEVSGSKGYIDRINDYLLAAHAQGWQAVLIIDEAQNLGTEVLEQLRLLTNLETNQHKLLQIILLGQPELRDKLARPELRQLAQRITARYHLKALEKKETGPYVAHRLAVAGCRAELFPAAILRRLHRLSGGVPRLMNVLCDRALLGAYVEGKQKVSRRILDRAAREALGEEGGGRPLGSGRSFWLRLAGGAGAAAVLVFLLFKMEPSLLPRLTGAEAVAVAESESGATPGLSSDLYRPAADGPHAWPADLAVGAGREAAFKPLLARWGIDDLQEGTDPCRLAEKHGLACLEQKGGWEMVRQLNRPAVLKIIDKNGGPYYAALTALNGEIATLQAGQRSFAVRYADLASRWEGDLILLWRPPPGPPAQLQLGSRGPQVAWLLERLARLRGETPPALPAEPLFDQALLRQVKEFQFTAGLLPDGIVGNQTLIRLDTALGGTPTLIAAKPSPGR